MAATQQFGKKIDFAFSLLFYTQNSHFGSAIGHGHANCPEKRAQESLLIYFQNSRWRLWVQF